MAHHMQHQLHPEPISSGIDAARNSCAPIEMVKGAMNQDGIDSRALCGIRDFLNRIPTEKLPDISRIILFGSHARGDFDEESDIDLAIALHGMPSQAGQRTRLVLELSESRDRTLLATSINVAPMIVWEGELSNPNVANNPLFYKNILIDGVEIPWVLTSSPT